MTDTATNMTAKAARSFGTEDPRWVRWLLIGLTYLFLAVFIVLPTVNVFAQAMGKGVSYYWQTFFPPQPGEKPQVLTTAQINKLPTEEERDAARAKKASLAEDIAAWEAKNKAYESGQRNWSAIRLTIGVVLVVVPLNAIFGLAAAWAVTRFRFPGKALLVSLIDLPFSVSPVVSGLIFVLIFGMRGIFADISRWQGGKWLIPAVQSMPSWVFLPLGIYLLGLIGSFVAQGFGVSTSAGKMIRKITFWGVLGLATVMLVRAYLIGGWAHDWIFLNPYESWSMPAVVWRGFGDGWGHIWPFGTDGKWEGVIFTPIAIAIATTFVTFPFIARTLIPVMAANGSEEEVAAVSLGANGWQMFWRVTVPNAKWGLFYGLVLCTARACGEFGAASVVSGHRESNDTLPLRIEKLWQETNTPGAFALASLLTMLALVTLGAKAFIEWRVARAGKVAVTK